MAAIRSRDTKPELSVRRLLHGNGYRFQVCRRVAGVRPDLVFTRRRKAVFVHGCFWHGCQQCGAGRTPKTRTEYWRAKLEGNKSRDNRSALALEEVGWKSMIVWECEIRRNTEIARRLGEFLGPTCWE